MRKSNKRKKIPWTHIITWISIFITSISIWVTVWGTRLSISRVEKQILRKDFKITSPLNGDRVDKNEFIQGETPFLGMHHYVIVTPVKIGTDWVQEEAKVSFGGLWSGKAILGAAAVGVGEKFVIRALATNTTLPPGPLTEVPKDAIFSELITVKRNQ